MKIVVNRCFGGFSLSALAVKRMAELNNKPCYFFKNDFRDGKSFHIPVSLEECDKSIFFSAFTVRNPNKFTEYPNDWLQMSDSEMDEYNKKYDEIYLTDSPKDRTDKQLIKVVKELGKDADGKCAKLEIIEIPDDVDWEIDEYDGMETVHEKHRSW